MTPEETEIAQARELMLRMYKANAVALRNGVKSLLTVVRTLDGDEGPVVGLRAPWVAAKLQAILDTVAEVER